MATDARPQLLRSCFVLIHGVVSMTQVLEEKQGEIWMVERKKYSKRYERTKGESVPYRFTAGDGLVLQLLADYRYLDFPMLQTLLMRSPATLARRLQKMYKKGLVDRPRVQRLRLQMQNDPRYRI